MASDVLIRGKYGWQSIHADNAIPDSVQAADAAGNFKSLTGSPYALGKRKFIRNAANTDWVSLDKKLTVWWNRPLLHHVIPAFTQISGINRIGHVEVNIIPALADKGGAALRFGLIGAASDAFEIHKWSAARILVRTIGTVQAPTASRDNPFSFIIWVQRPPEPPQYMYIHMSYGVDHAPDRTVLLDPNVHPFVISQWPALKLLVYQKPSAPVPLWTSAARSIFVNKTLRRGSRYSDDMSGYVKAPGAGGVSISAMGLPPGMFTNFLFPNLITGLASTPGTYNVTLIASYTYPTGKTITDTMNCTWTVV